MGEGRTDIGEGWSEPLATGNGESGGEGYAGADGAWWH